MIIVNSQKLTDFQKLVREYSDMIKLEFTKESAVCKLIDSSNVTFNTIELMKDWFEVYEPKLEEFYITIDNISKILAVCDKESTVEFKAGTGNEKGLLNVICKTSKFAYSITLRIIDKTLATRKTPGDEFYTKMSEYWNVYNISGPDFVDICKGISAIYTSDSLKDSTVRITIKDSVATFETEDMDKNKMACSLELNPTKLVTDKDISVQFSLSFIDTYIKTGMKMAGDNDDPTVSMFIGSSVPIRFVYTLHEGYCIVDTVLAPRIDQ